PRFYGLPKVHKVGPMKIRPIIVCCDNFSDKLMKVFKEVLNLLLWGQSTVSNSYELVNILENYAHFEPEDRLISFDVTSLYTRVPIQESLEIVQKRLQVLRMLPNDPISEITSMSDHAILQLLQLSLSNCYFTWQGKLYKQVAGLPMGGRLSPILANLFMEELEYKVLYSPGPLPKLFFHYVDDIVLLWDLKEGD
ncbi:MAG: hypothetical protein GY861_01450, partial [bacterium]|nr:hypothetical protein [bacterium]